MTVFSKKCLAFKNPKSTSEKDRVFKCPAQVFTYDLPEALRNDGYFKGAVRSSDIVIIDKPQNVDKVIKDTRPSRTKTKLEEKAEDLGIIDGGDTN